MVYLLYDKFSETGKYDKIEIPYENGGLGQKPDYVGVPCPSVRPSTVILLHCRRLVWTFLFTFTDVTCVRFIPVCVTPNTVECHNIRVLIEVSCDSARSSRCHGCRRSFHVRTTVVPGNFVRPDPQVVEVLERRCRHRQRKGRSSGVARWKCFGTSRRFIKKKKKKPTVDNIRRRKK